MDALFPHSHPSILHTVSTRDNRVFTGHSVARYVHSLAPLTPLTCSATLRFAPLALLRTLAPFAVGMWKRSIFMPLPLLPLPLPFFSSNTSSYPILQIGSGQSLPHPYL